jgi:hypothetical protein
MNLVVTQTRVKHYPLRPRAFSGYAKNRGKLIFPIKRSNKRSDRTDDVGGTGIETVQETAMCPKCAEIVRKGDI